MTDSSTPEPQPGKVTASAGELRAQARTPTPALRQRSTSKGRPWVRRPIAWIGGIVLAALGAALTGHLTGWFNDQIGEVTETGSPVNVDQVTTFRSDMTGDSVAFAAGEDFTDTDLAELNEQPQPVSWLEARGGVAVSTVYIQLVVSGNRADPVRITDIDVTPHCYPPLDGLLFDNPPAGADDSIMIHFDLDDPSPNALLQNVDGTTEAYFPARTISLADGEQQTIVVSAATNRHWCWFTLEMTVLEHSRSTMQTVAMADGTPFQVTAPRPLPEYEAVYLGGVICNPWVRANDAYIAGDSSAACTG